MLLQQQHSRHAKGWEVPSIVNNLSGAITVNKGVIAGKINFYWPISFTRLFIFSSCFCPVLPVHRDRQARVGGSPGLPRRPGDCLEACLIRTQPGAVCRARDDRAPIAAALLMLHCCCHAVALFLPLQCDRHSGRARRLNATFPVSSHGRTGAASPTPAQFQRKLAGSAKPLAPPSRRFAPLRAPGRASAKMHRRRSETNRSHTLFSARIACAFLRFSLAANTHVRHLAGPADTDGRERAVATVAAMLPAPLGLPGVLSMYRKPGIVVQMYEKVCMRVCVCESVCASAVLVHRHTTRYP